MKIIHFKIEQTNSDDIELRYYLDQPDDYETRALNLETFREWHNEAEAKFYTSFRGDLSKIGQKIYDWIDGADRFLARKIQYCIKDNPDLLVLAFSTDDKLSHIPWEILHDGKEFLVQHLNPKIVPVRFKGNKLSGKKIIRNRSLRLLFMATQAGNERDLDFEKEENMILNETKNQPIDIIVEESGNLDQLKNLIVGHEKNYFDVFHLTGHAGLNEEGPFFITETEIGERCLSPPKKIIRALAFHVNKLIVLSGCQTGQQGSKGSEPSFAEELVNSGIMAVISWGYSVSDMDASLAAAKLYGELSTGTELIEAISITYQELIEADVHDWHLLRLYLGNQIPGAFVTPLSERRDTIEPPIQTGYLDKDKKIRIASSAEFVGRRRLLQRCLRCLLARRERNEPFGVFLHGIGGIGKSSLAGRLKNRLEHHQYNSIECVGKIDESSLLNQLRTQYEQITENLDNILSNARQAFKFKLKSFFNKTKIPILLIIDNFESNFEMKGEQIRLNDGYPVISPEALKVLKALAFALNRNREKRHRIIITSRYELIVQESEYLLSEPVESLKDADLQKKINRLERRAKPQDNLKYDKLKSEAVGISDGNPRLLEWLYDIIQLDLNIDYALILERMREREIEFRESILAEELLKQQAPELKKMLSLGLIYELPVPKAAVGEICHQIPELEKHIDRATKLGFLEITLDHYDQLYRVPRILSPLLKSEIPQDQEVIYYNATKKLYNIWCEGSKDTSEERKLEIHRLALAGRETEIASKIAEDLSFNWIHTKHRFLEAEDICIKTLEIKKDKYILLLRLATAQETLGKLDLARNNYDSALNNCPGWDKDKKALIMKFLGCLYNKQGKIEKAKELCIESLRIRRERKDKRAEAESLHAIGNIYDGQGKFKQALENYYNSFKIESELEPPDIQGMAESLHAIAYHVAKLGFIEKALDFYKEALKMNSDVGDIKGMASNQNQMANIFAIKKDTDEAMKLWDEAKEKRDSVGDIIGIAESYQTKGDIFFEQKKIEDASIYYKKSLKISEEIRNTQKAAELIKVLKTIDNPPKKITPGASNEQNIAFEFIAKIRNLMKMRDLRDVH